MSEQSVNPCTSLASITPAKIDEVYEDIRKNFDISFCDRMLDETKEQEKIDPEAFSDRNHARKYLNYEIHLKKSIRRALALDLNKSEKKRILDIGTGAGYFPLVCNYLGHDCEATEVYDGGFLGPLIKHFGFKCHVLRIASGVPCSLPDPKFDIITSFEIAFSRHKRGERSWDFLWTRHDWKMLIDDLRTNHLNAGGVIWLSLNRHFEGGKWYDDDLLDFFEETAECVNKQHVMFHN